MYIVNSEQVENIYNQIKDLEVYSFEGETIIDPSYDIGDILVIEGKQVIYQGELEYQGKFKANIKSKIQAKTEQESMQTKGSTSVKIRRIQSEIDQANGKITQLTQETTENTEKLTQVEQTVDGVTREIKDTTDKIQDKITTIEDKIDGITLDKTVTGGQNLIRNSVGYFGHEYWQIDDENEGNVINNTSPDVKKNSTSGSALELQAETIYQNINEIQNGEYYLSFNYIVLKENTICSLKINNEEIELTKQNWTEIEKIINVTTNSIKIEITSDIASSLLITDLMLSAGNTKVSWSQNSNESYSDGVQIGKGLKIKSTGSDTELNADAEGINVKNTSTGENVAEFTKYGTTTEELTVNKNIKLTDSLLIQRVGEQTWFCSL